MSDLPLVSIITPSFNQAAFLEQTICSVLEQDYPNLEYWVIDGGSTDGSLEIIQDYAHRLSGWISEKDHGQADAINKGLRRISGEVVAWLNSDDLYRSGAISAAAAALQQNPKAGLVFSDVESIDETGTPFNLMHYANWGLQNLMTFHIMGQASVFMRRSVLDQVGYLDLSYHYLLDHQLWLRMGLVSDFHYVPGAIWAAARIHPGAKNVAQTTQFGEEAYRLVAWMEQEPAFQPYFIGKHNQVWAGAHRLNGFYLLDAGLPKKALKAYWQGLRQYPPAVLPDWRRILYAAFSPLGIKKLRQAYLNHRKNRYHKKVQS